MIGSTTKSLHTMMTLSILLSLLSCNSKSKVPVTTDTKTDVVKGIEQLATRKYAGVYSFGDVEIGRSGTIIVYPLTDSSVSISLDLSKGPPSYNMGRLDTNITIRDGIGVFDMKSDDELVDCLLQFKFSKGQVDISYGPEDSRTNCGFGGNVYANGTYQQKTDTIPQFFITQEGDTINFTK
jgi:hypothetical protein